MSGRDGPERLDGPLSQWPRLIWLDAQIRAGSYPNVARLQEEFGVRRRTAFSMIGLLRDSLNAPLVYDHARKGYTYSDPTYALPAVFLSEGELLALFLAEQVARQYLGTPLETPLRAAIEKIARYLPEAVRIELGDLADAFQFAGGGGPEVSLRLMSDIRRAIRERRALRILYYSAHRGETNEREVEPHFIRSVRGDQMLVAWDRLRDADRVFMLSRIAEHTVLEDRFEPRPALSPDTYSDSMFLTERGSGEPQEVVLRFDSYQARWIRERVWHPSQTLEELPDGGVILRLAVSGEGDLLRWILGYGEHVEVLAPASLREKTVALLRAAVEVYGG